MLRGFGAQHNERTGISELEYRAMEITQSEQWRESSLERKNELLGDPWGYNKRCYILVFAIFEGEERESSVKRYSQK